MNTLTLFKNYKFILLLVVLAFSLLSAGNLRANDYEKQQDVDQAAQKLIDAQREHDAWQKKEYEDNKNGVTYDTPPSYTPPSTGAIVLLTIGAVIFCGTFIVVIAKAK